MDNVVRLPVPRFVLPRALRAEQQPDDIAALIDRIERFQESGELGPSSHDRLLSFLHAVRYQAYGRRGWAELVSRLEAAVERSACVQALLASARRQS